MFICATVITTIHLDSIVPVICYIACFIAEVAEMGVVRDVLRQKDLGQRQIDRTVFRATLVAGFSSLAVSVFGVVVAYHGDEAFLFVPLTYLFAAALYASIFNHPVLPILVVRMVTYVIGFLALGSVGFFTSPQENNFSAFAVFCTAVSASAFFVMNAVVFRQNYIARRRYEQELIDRELLLRQQMEGRHNAERARDSSETRFKSLFESAPIPIREEDLSGIKRKIDALNLPDPKEFASYLDAHPEFLDACAREIVVIDANRAALVEHGYSDKSEMLRQVVKTLSPAAKKIVRKTVTTIHEGRSGNTYETTIRTKDGETRNVTATWTVLPGSEDTYERILLCSVDITERLNAEDALRQAQKMEAVGQLTGGVAHDINNLLTIVSGNLSFIEESGGVDQDFSNPIRDAVRRGAEMTQRLLSFSRKQPLKAQTIDVSEMVSGISTMLKRSLSDRYRFEIDKQNGLWPAFADAAQLETAILNLTLNARDAMPDGGSLVFECRNTSVDADNTLDLAPGNYVKLSVVDTGVGMPPDVVKRVFEPFFTTKQVGEGSGLGLSMVYGFAKQSEGTVEVSSDPGVGTRISLYLPRSDYELPSVEEQKPKVYAHIGQGEMVLVLEDENDVRSYLCRLLSSAGYTPIPAADAQSARKIFSFHKKIDLLLSDVTLAKGAQGHDFASEILSQRPDLPVVFMTGRPDDMLNTKDKSLLAYDVIQKPFSGEEILERIYAGLNKEFKS